MSLKINVLTFVRRDAFWDPLGPHFGVDFDAKLPQERVSLESGAQFLKINAYGCSVVHLKTPLCSDMLLHFKSLAPLCSNIRFLTLKFEKKSLKIAPRG